MKGFKKTGNGPRYGKFSFSPKAGFSGSTGRVQNVRGYTRSAPAKKFAHGGMVTTPMASGDSSAIKRTKPVTSFDAEHGGKAPLRPGFNKGGKACYAEGGKVGSMGAAIKMVKQLMAQGNSADQAAAKAAGRFGVPKAQLKTPAPTGGGGMAAEKQMLSHGGMAGGGKMHSDMAKDRPMMQNIAKQAVMQHVRKAPPSGHGVKLARGGMMMQRPPVKSPMTGPMTGRAAPARPAMAQAPMARNHGYGSFRGRPLIGRG